MSRTLSFGYNAVAALGERVVERIVRAAFEDGTIDQTIANSFTLGNASGTFHVLLSDPEIDLSAGASDRLWLILRLHAVLEFPKPPALFGLVDGDWLKAKVRIRAKLTQSGSKLQPDVTALSPYDIKVENSTSSNATLLSVAPLFLSTEVSKALAAPSFKKLEVNLGIDPDSLASDSIDVALLDGAPPADRDEMALALFDSKSKQTTRGKASALKPFLGSGQSFAVRISRATFDALMKQSLDQQFLRFDLKLGDQQAEKTYRVGWGETSPLMFLFGLASTSDKYDIRLLADSRRENLRQCRITNLRTGENSIWFATTDKGESTQWNILYSEPEPIFMQDLKQGDVLRFQADHKLEKGAKIYYPSFKLGQGKIIIAAKAVADVACYDDVTAHLQGDVQLAIDPATGEMRVDAGEPDVDLPWYVDIGLGLLKGLLYAFTGPFAALIIAGYEDTLTEQIETQAKKKSGTLLPKISGTNRLRLFWEGITLKKEGIILHGQIESGWLRGGGRTLGLRAPLDAEQKIVQEIEVNEAAGYVSLTAHSLPSGLDTSALVVVPQATTFEQLGADDIAKLTAGKTAQAVTVPSGNALVGTVLAVRTALGRYAKVRVDRSKSKQWVLRWITYFVPAAPSVNIAGGMKPNKDKTRYTGTFSAKAGTNLYGAHGLKVTWKYAGPGTTKIIGDRISVEVDFEKHNISTVWFLSTLQVQVTDIFGRQATATRKLSGTYGERYDKPLPEQKRKPGPGQDDEDLLDWIRERGLDNPRIRELIEFTRVLDDAGIPLNQAAQLTDLADRLAPTRALETDSEL